jgi:hypothetical protein
MTRRGSEAAVVVIAVAMATIIGFCFRWMSQQATMVDLTGIVITDPSGIGTPIDVRMGALGSGGSVRVVRADMADAVHRGHDLSMSLVFGVDEPLDTEWTVFVHIEREGYRLNADHPPASGRHPTSAWRAGEFIVDAFRKTVPQEAPTGRYEVWVGLYRGQERLRLVNAGNASDGADRLRVGVLEVL